MQRVWPWTLPVPAEILRLVDLAPGDVASLEAQPDGGFLLQPFRQWLRTLPAPWGDAEGRAIADFLHRDLFFIGPQGPFLVMAVPTSAAAGRVVLQMVERAGEFRLAFSPVTPAPAPAGKGEP